MGITHPIIKDKALQTIVFWSKMFSVTQNNMILLTLNTTSTILLLIIRASY